MAQEEPFPVHETVKVLKGVTINKSGKWWSAALMVETYGKRQVALYLWRKDNEGKWKRQQKFIVPPKDMWEKTKKIIDEELLPTHVKP